MIIKDDEINSNSSSDGSVSDVLKNDEQIAVNDELANREKEL